MTTMENQDAFHAAAHTQFPLISPGQIVLPCAALNIVIVSVLTSLMIYWPHVKGCPQPASYAIVLRASGWDHFDCLVWRLGI